MTNCTGPFVLGVYFLDIFIERDVNTIVINSYRLVSIVKIINLEGKNQLKKEQAKTRGRKLQMGIWSINGVLIIWRKIQLFLMQLARFSESLCKFD